MVSWFVKQALLDIARDTHTPVNEPKSREGWGQLAHKLGVKGIHIAERDTQRSKRPKPSKPSRKGEKARCDSPPGPFYSPSSPSPSC